MDLGLRDRVALVTGASRGIGLSIAHSLVSEGARLGICARGEQGLAEATQVLRDAGVELNEQKSIPQQTQTDVLDVPAPTNGSTEHPTVEDPPI